MERNIKQAIILTPEVADGASRKKLPKSWTDAAGMMKHHKVALEKYAKHVRKEWGRRA